MVSASTSGGAAAQALRALRRAAQLHTERRASAAKPAKLDATRTRGRGRAMLGSSQPDPVPCSQSSQLPSSQLPSSQLPSSQVYSSQLLSSQMPSSQLPLSQPDPVPGDKCGSQRDPRDILASMSTQTPLSNAMPSSLDTLPASQAVGLPEAAPAKQVPLHAAVEASSAFQAQQGGVAEAVAALAAALATCAGSGANQEVVRRRYRFKAPPPGPSSPPSSVRQRSPSSTHQRKRKPARKVKSRAEVVKEVCSKTTWASVSRLSEEVRKLEKERAAHRTRCQKAATEALRLLNDHQKACKESSEAFAGTAKAADAALAAVAALERSRGSENGRLAAPTNSFSGTRSALPPPGQLRKRVRRIDGIAASNCS